MAQALGFLVGLKSIDPSAYSGWDGRNGCYGCELDVDNMELVLSSLGGYKINTLKTEEAKASAILRGIESAAASLKSGDMFVFYFSGHGGQQADLNDEEDDSQDETLIAYDRPIIDDELSQLWPLFQRGVRIVMLSDSCNSGTNYRNLFNKRAPLGRSTPIEFGEVPNMKAQMIHFSGCRDGKTSSGYQLGGAFTMALCEIWDSGRFVGTYEDFHKRIKQRVKDAGEEQEPQFNLIGKPSPDFLLSKPFSISTKNIPEFADVEQAIDAIPVSILHRPSLAKENTLRVEPFTAAVVGVVVGGGLALASRGVEITKDNIDSLECDLTVKQLKDKAYQVIDSAQGNQELYDLLAKAASNSSRIFGIDDAAASAFLSGVLVGAGVVKQ